MKKNIHLSAEPLEIGTCRDFASGNSNGAECIFIGTVRNATDGRTVHQLHFECYESMAMKEMDKIAGKALPQFEISAIAIHHRIGTLAIGDIPVIIAVGAAHRGAAFSACQFAIDTLKESVPIWKKEFFEDGEVWVSAHP